MTSHVPVTVGDWHRRVVDIWGHIHLQRGGRSRCDFKITKVRKLQK